ncbi:hypothetical protein RB195_018486 [Necator americanus]
MPALTIFVAYAPTSIYEEEVDAFYNNAKIGPRRTLEKLHIGNHTSSQRGAARATDNQELMCELARFCREAIKEDLREERRAEVLAEGGKKHPLCLSRLRESQDDDDYSAEQEENNHREGE